MSSSNHRGGTASPDLDVVRKIASFPLPRDRSKRLTLVTFYSLRCPARGEILHKTVFIISNTMRDVVREIPGVGHLREEEESEEESAEGEGGGGGGGVRRSKVNETKWQSLSTR